VKITAGRDDTARLDLSDAEKNLFRSVFSDTASLLGGGSDVDAAADGDDLAKRVGLWDVERPSDPALLRLLPDVDPKDPERSAEFRRLTDFDLRESKLSNLRTALFTLGSTGRIVLDAQGIRAWLTALADVRLVVATRLGVETETDFEALYSRESDLPEQEMMLVTVYDFLSWAQERLAEIMLDSLNREEP
jgi:hypothetical protein